MAGKRERNGDKRQGGEGISILCLCMEHHDVEQASMEQ